MRRCCLASRWALSYLRGPLTLAGDCAASRKHRPPLPQTVQSASPAPRTRAVSRDSKASDSQRASLNISRRMTRDARCCRGFSARCDCISSTSRNGIDAWETQSISHRFRRWRAADWPNADVSTDVSASLLEASAATTARYRGRSGALLRAQNYVKLGQGACSTTFTSTHDSRCCVACSSALCRRRARSESEFRSRIAIGAA